MSSKIFKKAISRITPEERAEMVKSLEIISQIHFIMDKKGINQKTLAEMLNVSPAAVSKMLLPGSNLGMKTIVKLELLFGETILTTPQKIEEEFEKYIELPLDKDISERCLSIVWNAAEETGMEVAITG
ncbi:MAG: helix-turn-helix domain-containing protein [Sphingobacteriaceae bacterium]|nr:helix-turn-helix domain-containing protein [Sphingobacteriaceae bacterium]